jgi:Cd2+/Zn2+-exporting ATPase
MTTCAVCEVHAESVFRVEGMDCHEEVAILEQRLKRLSGFETFHADVLGQRLSIQYDAALLTTSGIAEAVAQTGMRAWLEHEESRPAPSAHAWRDRLIAAATVLVVVGFALQLSASGSRWAWIPFAAAILLGGVHTARRAWASIKARVLDIYVLMLVAVAGAIALGEWSEGASVVLLFALAQLLETRAMERARGAIRALMDLAPTTALVRRGTSDVTVAVDEVRVGDVVLVRPGEKIPLDGRVSAGVSHVNQAPVTGESLPVEKQAGDEVFAGTINGRGALDVDVTRLRRDSTLARIIHLVERAQAQRAPSQTFVDRFARVYTPVVLGVAVAVALVPPLLAGGDWGTWIYRSLVLLVISCPCALVISTPVSIVSALAAAARKGVLIKGGARLEALAGVRCVAFDKTGTLTSGQVHVTDIVAFAPATAASLLSAAASLETRSEHPLGRAILDRARTDGVAVIGGMEVLVGSHRLFEECGLSSPSLRASIESLASRGRSTVIVATGGTVAGVIGVGDEVRTTARDTIELLRGQGVEHVVLLTGDHEAAARSLASALGIDDYRASLLPEDKVDAVHELRRTYGSVAMVGDGVNDAPALASADVGIAMGVAGSDAALETADVALMADELAKIPYTLRLSRATTRNIRANIAFSLVLKSAFLVMAIAGSATLWMAVVADTGASLIVIANALRLLKE